MTIGVPGQYRWLSDRAVYDPKQVGNLLPVVFGGPPWNVEPVRSVGACIHGEGRCTHNCLEDQWAEGCIVDGDHYRCVHQHNGHDRCGFCICIDPAAISGTSSREPDPEVTRIDLEIGFRKAPMSSDIREALELRHRYGYSQDEIAMKQGMARRTISYRLSAGHKRIADYLNGLR